jgi:predicted NBD/HSP70 family sugar kinase
MDLIFESERDSVSPGRKSVSLYLKKDLFYTCGVSFYQEYGSEAALLNADSELVDKIVFHTANSQRPANWREICRYASDAVKTLLERNNIPKEKFAGVGASLTGFMNPETGEIYYSAQFKEADKFNLAEYFRDALHAPCFIINVPHLQVLMEHKWGKAKELDSFLYVCFGFGLGMFLNGKLYKGSQGFGGEIGYMKISDKGPEWPDGRVGLLGANAKIYDISNTLRNYAKQGLPTEVKKYLGDGNKVSYSMMLNALRDGDKTCRELMSKLFEPVSEAVVNLAYIFNPEVIFFPPWAAEEAIYPYSLRIVEKHMKHYGAFTDKCDFKTKVMGADLGYEELSRGAGLLPAENLFEVKK